MPSNKSLQKAMNGFPAQTYHEGSSRYEETHGSNNAPHMKVTDPNTGEPIDPREVTFPEDMNANVVQELESVKAELQALKEHTFNTRLSGSNMADGLPVKTLKENPVEIIVDSNIIVEAGSTYYLEGELEHGVLHSSSSDVRHYTHFSLGVQKQTNQSEAVANIHVRNKLFGTNGSLSEDFNESTSSTGLLAIIEKTPISFHNMSIRLSHEADVSMEFRDFAVVLWKA